MVTSNFIIVNKTSTSKPLLILNKKLCMKEIKSDWIVMSEYAEIERDLLVFHCCQSCNMLFIYLFIQ